MYRIVMQRFPEESATCFAEMSGKKVHEANKKTIENRLKTRCESIRVILERIRQRLIDGIEPDKQAGAMFIGDKPYRMSGAVKNLFMFCAEVIRSSYKEPKENVDLTISTMLLRTIY